MHKLNSSFLNSSHILWDLGFRPFFLFGSIFILFSLSLWILSLTGNLEIGLSLSWHAHEMIFGFSSAIVAGFLLTASANWTGSRGVCGKPLQLLTACWIIGRILPFISILPKWISALVDLTFLPFLILLLFPYLNQKKQRKNLILLFLLALMSLGNLLYHLDSLALSDGNEKSRGLLLGMHILLVLISLIGGRVLPFFTKQAVPQSCPLTFASLDIAVVILTLLFTLSHFSLSSHFFTHLLSVLCGIAHFIRWILWKPWQSLKTPILWILFLAYFWLIIGFLLETYLAWSTGDVRFALHAYTTGTIGIFIYGMITRVALAHTGRPIKASHLTLFAYLLLGAAAFIRTFLPIIYISQYLNALIVSAVMWILAYMFFLIQYTKILTAKN